MITLRFPLLRFILASSLLISSSATIPESQSPISPGLRQIDSKEVHSAFSDNALTLRLLSKPIDLLYDSSRFVSFGSLKRAFAKDSNHSESGISQLRPRTVLSAVVLLIAGVTLASAQAVFPDDYKSKADSSYTEADAIPQQVVSLDYARAKLEPSMLKKIPLLTNIAEKFISTPAAKSALDDLWRIQFLSNDPASAETYKRFLSATGVLEASYTEEHLRVINTIYTRTNQPMKAILFNKNILENPRLTKTTRAQSQGYLKDAYLAVGDYASYASMKSPKRELDDIIRGLDKSAPIISDGYGIVGTMKNFARNPNSPIRISVQKGLTKHLKNLKRDRFGARWRSISNETYLRTLFDDINHVLRQDSQGVFGLEIDGIDFDQSLPLFGKQDGYSVFQRKLGMSDSLGKRFNFSIGRARTFKGGMSYGNGMVDLSISDSGNDDERLTHDLLVALAAHEFEHELGMMHMHNHARRHPMLEDLLSRGHRIANLDGTSNTIDGHFLRAPDTRMSAVPTGITDFTRTAIGWDSPDPTTPTNSFGPNEEPLDRFSFFTVHPFSDAVLRHSALTTISADIANTVVDRLLSRRRTRPSALPRAA